MAGVAGTWFTRTVCYLHSFRIAVPTLTLTLLTLRPQLTLTLTPNQ